MRNARLNKTSKKIILNVFNYFLQKPQNNKSFKQDILKETVAATGYSKTTVKNIIREKKTHSTLRSPKKRKRPKPKTNVDSFTECAIRRIIHSFHVNEKTQVSHRNYVNIVYVIKKNAIRLHCENCTKRLLLI